MPFRTMTLRVAKIRSAGISRHLTSATKKRGDSHPDDSLPAGFKKIKKADYNNGGFDRGHICNSKDRTDTRENNDATFL